MKHVKQTIAAAVGCIVLVSGLALAQQADTTPTADIDHEPRTVEELGFSRPGYQDSVMDGGTAWGSGAPPASSVRFPTLCEVDPAHPDCNDDPVRPPGGLNPPERRLTCSFGWPDGIGFTETITSHNGGCSQNGRYSFGVSKTQADSLAVYPVFQIQGPVAPGTMITWLSGCEGGVSADQRVCTGESRAVVTTMARGEQWGATVRVIDLMTGFAVDLNATALFAPCGVEGGIQCQ